MYVLAHARMCVLYVRAWRFSITSVSRTLHKLICFWPVGEDVSKMLSQSFQTIADIFFEKPQIKWGERRMDQCGSQGWDPRSPRGPGMGSRRPPDKMVIVGNQIDPYLWVCNSVVLVD